MDKPQFLLIKKQLAKLWPKYFSFLYSTLDEPAIVPVQVAAYKFVLENYLMEGDRVLDIGFGLGYGLEILSKKSVKLSGIETDGKAVSYGQKLFTELENLETLQSYDGKTIPYSWKHFEVVTCIDVLEHVSNYMGLLNEMVRVCKRIIVVSTPLRRPEFILPNGRPRNPWHLREWSYDELNAIILSLSGVIIDWNFINGPLDGPFNITKKPSENTLALSPVLLVE